jgi:antitoxin-like ribbon-helix-helix protein
VDRAALSMTDAIKAVADGVTRGRRSEPAPRAQSSLTQAMQKVASRKRNPPTTRTGRKGIVIYVDQEVAAAIRRLAADYDTTVQALGETAFKYLFEKLGEPSRP